MRRSLVLSLGLAALLLAGPAAAAGSHPPPKTSPRTFVRLDLDGSNDYAATVAGFGDRIVLAVRHGRTIVTYEVPATLSPHRVRAKFSGLGRISLRFQPRGEVRVRSPDGCAGARSVPGHSGVFRGTISFRGEDDFVELDASRASGRSATSTQWGCAGVQPAAGSAGAPPGEEDEEPKPPVFAVLIAQASGRWLNAIASDPEEELLPFFSAAVRERRGTMRVVRATSVVDGPATSFSFVHSLASATLQPPAPFSGSATFQRAVGGAATWTGDLAVSLPGREAVSLVAPPLKVTLTHGIPPN